MYCPSCDKSYGAIHSRCPECHSWLKVSAPSSARSKSGKTGTFSAVSPGQGSVGASAVSTVPRDSGISWADPAPASKWDSGSSGTWGDPPGSPEAPSTGLEAGWGGGASASAWGESAGTSWSGSEPASAAPAPAPAPKPNGWLGGEADDDWGGGGLATSPPVGSAPKPRPQSNGWLGGDDPPDLPAPKAQRPNSGWLGEGVAAPSSPSLTDSPGDGWHAGASEPTAGRGWLVDAAADAPGGESGRGWLVDGGGLSAPSMTEMVDQAIHNETDDDFVDDSWVDEEIRDSEFDELDVPEIAHQSPEAGGTVLKMVLVAFLSILVLGGVFFFRDGGQSEEKKQADKVAMETEFAMKAIQGGKDDMAAGRPEFAVPQFQQAAATLKAVNADPKMIEDTEVLVGKAMIKAGELENAVTHWRTLKNSQDPAVAKQALDGIKESSRRLRIQANETLKEAKTLAAKGEVNTVLPRAREALKIYKEYGGTPAQQGDAYGVMGRSYLNGRDYGNAQDNLRLAVKMNPGAGYQHYLAQVNERLQPVYHSAPAYSPEPRTSAPQQRPTFDIGGPSYQTRTGPAGGGRNTSNSGGGNNSSGGEATQAPQRMKEIPIYKGGNRNNNSGGPRKGQQGVLQGY